MVNSTTTENKPGYKKTKLGWIPEEWELINFNDIGDKKVKWSITGGPFGSDLKSEHYTKEGIRIVQLQNLGDGLFLEKGWIYTSKEKADSLKACNVFPGEIILAKMGDPVTRACIIPNNSEGRYLMGSDGIRLVADENIFDRNFVKEYINFSVFRKLAMRHSTGTTRQRIGLTDLKKLPFISPPLPEQEKIAAILSTWDEAIETTTNLISQLKKRKKGLMQQLLTGRKRLPGLTGKWRKIEIGEIATQFSVKNKENKVEEVLSCTKYDGLVRSLEYFGRKVYGDDLSKYKIVPKNYFAYATNHIEEGSIGYQNVLENGLVSPMYTVFKTNDSVNDAYMYMLFKTERMIYNYQSNMSGSIARRGGLRWNVFEMIIINIPDKTEQQAIAQVLQTAEEEIKTQEQKLHALQAQKKGLMQQLLTGQTRVKV